MDFGFDEQMKLLKEKFNKDLVFEEDLRKKRYKRVDVTLHDKIK